MSTADVVFPWSLISIQSGKGLSSNKDLHAYTIYDNINFYGISKEWLAEYS